MARVVAPGALPHMTVPNRMDPFDINTGKLGWNYFPKLLNARIVGTSAWEVKKLARPSLLKLHHTPPSNCSPRGPTFA
jgi:hypothetical protein